MFVDALSERPRWCREVDSKKLCGSAEDGNACIEREHSLRVYAGAFRSTFLTWMGLWKMATTSGTSTESSSNFHRHK